MKILAFGAATSVTLNMTSINVVSNPSETAVSTVYVLFPSLSVGLSKSGGALKVSSPVSVLSSNKSRSSFVLPLTSKAKVRSLMFVSGAINTD